MMMMMIMVMLFIRMVINSSKSKSEYIFDPLLINGEKSDPRWR